MEVTALRELDSFPNFQARLIKRICEQRPLGLYQLLTDLVCSKHSKLWGTVVIFQSFWYACVDIHYN